MAGDPDAVPQGLNWRTARISGRMAGSVQKDGTMARLGYALALSLLAGPAGAQAPVISCWDGTFAYTFAALREGAQGWEFRLQTWNESLFARYFPEADLDWAEATLAIAAEECAVDAERSLFDCQAGAQTATLTRDMLGADGREVLSLDITSARIRFFAVDGPSLSPDLTPSRILELQIGRDGRADTLAVDFLDIDGCDRPRGPFAPD